MEAWRFDICFFMTVCCQLHFSKNICIFNNLKTFILVPFCKERKNEYVILHQFYRVLGSSIDINIPFFCSNNATSFGTSLDESRDIKEVYIHIYSDAKMTNHRSSSQLSYDTHACYKGFRTLGKRIQPNLFLA
jgi:hypothetical protein